MVTIVAHTTRATGTVLTASIYNTDHQNHVTNATTINATAAYKDVANSFTANQTIDAAAATLTIKGTGNSGIEHGRVDGVSSTPFIDFHSGTTAISWDSRIIASGGDGTAGGGSLQIAASSLELALGTGVIKQSVTNSGLKIFGGIVSDGANLELYGSTHATDPNKAFIDADTTTFRNANGAGTPTVKVGTGTVITDATYTAADVLTKLLTVDGPASGLDADLLDGLNATAAATASTIMSRDAGGDTAVDMLTATQLSYATSLIIGDAATEDFRFSTDGFLSNGITAEKTAITDAGTGLSFHKGGIVWVSRAGAVQGLFNRDTNDGICLHFGREKVPVGSISVTAAATAYNTSSDISLKYDFQPINPASLDSIKVYDFAWKSGAGRAFGVAAQELITVFPQAVTRNDDGLLDVDYSKLVPWLIAKCQDLEKRLAALEAI